MSDADEILETAKLLSQLAPGVELSHAMRQVFIIHNRLDLSGLLEPEAEDQINALYGQLAALGPADGAEREALTSSIRRLQEQEAARFKAAFAARRAVEVEAAEDLFARADKLIAEHAAPSARNKTGN